MISNTEKPLPRQQNCINESEPVKHTERSQKPPQFVFVLSDNYTFEFTNHTFEAIFGSPGKKSPCYAILRGNAQPCPNCPMKQTISKHYEQAWVWEDTLRGRIFEMHCYPFKSHKTTRSVVGFGVDITAKIRKSGEQNDTIL